jgi:hypothetical protein
MACGLTTEGFIMAFEVVEFCEPAPQPGQPFAGTSETLLGEYQDEKIAIDAARTRWREMRVADTADVMWWIVRVPGESRARWVADRSSNEEQILDLTTMEMVRVVD